ncbi:hypothetical protein Hanom_Chr14g01253491 [Helianthus anomalus]
MRTKYLTKCLNDATAYGAGSTSCCTQREAPTSAQARRRIRFVEVL